MAAFWFKQKRYGLGASRSSWEGWAVLALYVAGCVAISTWFEQRDAMRSPDYVLSMLGLTIALALIAWRKTEGGWHWRWGRRD